jgi:hypothetical protein
MHYLWLEIKNRGPQPASNLFADASGTSPELKGDRTGVGPMARSVRDIALAFSLLAGPDGAVAISTSFLRSTRG